MIKTKTKVIFKKFSEGDVIAIFPRLAGDSNLYRTCLSYMHVGQHAAIDLNLISKLAPCTPEEYSKLFEELVGQGYDDLVIGKHVTQKDFEERKRSVGK